MTKKRIIISASVWLLLCIGLAAFYATAYKGHILWQEQNQVFLNTTAWASTYFGKPAWLGCLAGDWLTQFFHTPLVGAIILALAIACCAACFECAIRRLFSNARNRRSARVVEYALTFLFAILLTALSMPASTTLAFYVCLAGGISLALIRIRIPAGKGGSIDLSPILIVPAYWAFGFGALATAILILAFALTQAFGNRNKKYWWIPAAGTIIFGLATPACLSECYALPYAKALVYPGVARPSLPDFDNEERMAIADAFYNGDYGLTKQLALKAGNPGGISAFYYYLASAMQDSLPDNLLKYDIKNLGTLITINDSTPLPVINMMNDLYYQLGDMTYAERAAMMRNVFSPRNRNVRMIKRLAEINLVSADTLAALKYLRILDGTHAYAGWSRAHTPGQTAPSTVAEIMRRRALSNNKDNIRLGDNCRNILLELLESNPRNSMALDYLLCTDLLLKDMDTFKMDYDTYCMAKGSPRYKRLYQEALMIWLAGTEASEEEWERYIVPGTTTDAFRRYSSRRGDPAFSNTYWYYFDRQ